MPDRLFWIWHQLLFGFGTARSHEMMELAGHPRELWNSPLLTREEAARSAGAMERAKRVEERTLRKGCHIVTPGHPDYPEWLESAYAKPAVLYVKGELGCLRHRLAIALVGTRRASEYGARAAEFFAEELARQGAVIVSGLAVGIDSISHGAALRAGGQTVGVLGCGLDQDYPRDSAPLKRAMVESGGAVVTEYPLGTPPLKGNFPQRNRIIAGVSRGVLVAEAGIRSGALITARLALDMGRDVFAVPGSIFEEKQAGGNLLLKEGMAKAVSSAADIWEEYPESLKKAAPKEAGTYHSPESGANRNIPLPQLSERKAPGVKKAKANQEKWSGKQNHQKEDPESFLPPPPQRLAQVYHAVDDNPRSTDAIAASSGMEVGRVMADLVELEILGYLEARPGGTFVVIR